MIFLITFITLHILCWGTVGAVLAPRAGLPVIAGALLSILLPVIGSLVLAGMALWGANGVPAYQHSSSWLRAGWIGVAGGAIVALSAILPWVEMGVSGEIGTVDEDVVSFAAADFVALPATLAISGLAMALFAWLAIRRGSREWLVGAVLFAWLPAFLGSTLVLSEGFIDSWVGRANSIDDVLSEQNIIEAGVSADYQIGAGSYAALTGGLAVLVWGFVWSLRRADGAVALTPSRSFALSLPGRSESAAIGGGGALYAGNALTDVDDWDDPLVRGTQTDAAPSGPLNAWSDTPDEWADDASFRADDEEGNDRWW